MDIYYLNLNESENRRDFMELQSEKLKKKFIRIPGVNGAKLKDRCYSHLTAIRSGLTIDQCRPAYYMNRTNFKTMSMNIDNILPKVGLYLSTIIALRTAIKNKSQGCIILEDDAIINSLDIPPIDDADIIYLGGTISGSSYDEEKNIIKIYPDRVKIYGTFGYCIPTLPKMVEILQILLSPYIDGFKGYDKHQDWRSGRVKLRVQSIDLFFINYFQKYGNCFLLNPLQIEHPLDNESTINNKPFDYKKNNLRFRW